MATPPTSFSKDTLQPTQTPFQNIGLAFSGGGFRAASYCLGTLSYLHQVPWAAEPGAGTLLDHVSYISSASGGTITNATYALGVARGKTFAQFYRHLFTHLEGLDLLTKVFEILNDDGVWKAPEYREKRRNLINAFAIAYDQTIFAWPDTDAPVDAMGEKPAGARLAALMDGAPDGPLDEVCFNTTEFYRGVLFRQAVKLKPDNESAKEFPYGNYILNLTGGIQRGIRMADTLAASSCFPAGFEPIVFPSDFATGELRREDILRNTCIQPQEADWTELRDLFPDADIRKVLQGLGQPVDVLRLRSGLLDLEGQGELKKDFETGFMDGGIDDNQGIDSLMRANARRERGSTRFKPFDLMLTNDVGSHYMDPYTPVPKETHRGLMALSLRTIRWGSLVLGVLGIADIALALWALDGPWSIALTILGTAVALVFWSVYAGISWLRRFVKGKVRKESGLNLEHAFSKPIADRLVRFFGGTPLGVLADMLKARAASVLTLTNDVFLKRIRQLLYERILDEGRGCFRMKTNHVYDLAYSNDINRLQNDYGGAALRPTQVMQVVAQTAFEMGTTLWFSEGDAQDKDHNQAGLIATGQFTTCYNLLLFIRRMKAPAATGKSFWDGLEREWQERVDFLHDQMAADYRKFQQDPFWLYNSLGGTCGIPGFQAASMAAYPFPKAGFRDLRTEGVSGAGGVR